MIDYVWQMHCNHPNLGKLEYNGTRQSGHENLTVLLGWRIKIIEDNADWDFRLTVGRINGMTPLTAFSLKKMYGRFAGTKRTGRNNEVTVLTR